MSANAPIADELVLGTAMWGWTVDKATAFQLLDAWYAAGQRKVDTATNYPIDRVPEHFRLAEQILAEWIRANGVEDLQVNIKVGSLNNMHTPDHLLTRSFMLIMLDEYQFLFGNNLHTFMVHWDNREDEKEVEDTFLAFGEVVAKGLCPGLSGIRHPEIYASLNDTYGFDFDIQLKHNVVQSDVERYARHFSARCFYAYGINAGGLKLEEGYSDQSSIKARGADPEKFNSLLNGIRTVIAQAKENKNRPALNAMHQVGLIYAAYHPQMKGVLVGPSKVHQLESTLDFFRSLRQYDYRDVYEELVKLNQN
ncbi:MAG: hypothetical protein Kow0027_22670 [Saprospiraceae bacterium]